VAQRRQEGPGALFSSWPAAAALAAGLVLAQLCGPAVARAQEPQPPAVELNKLLKLPQSFDYDIERRGGATRTEWRARFQDARAEVAKCKQALDKARGNLEQAAAGSDSWRFVPPGGDVTAENQENIKMRKDVERKREALTSAEARLRELEIEANLGSVPPEWRE
jgi:hypothetical protein